ncbi:MAG TPA: electron transfer flavoprotein subunit beta/FixA family protein [Oligoflexia bacterium]|nr:electron transfer flavoprotein subunit beta/FixA family protein [Oligoflexia bacterium]HMP27836.1 electron transfer flavoprotein subunit beta/FixA family protein [Oligoflexia bacterium]
MKILVPIKRVPDYQSKVKLTASGDSIDHSTTKWIINPFDEIALEEALRIKERGCANEVVAISIGPLEVEAQLRSALAMGADSAILAKVDQNEIDSAVAASILAEIWKRSEYSLAIIGKQAIDSDASQTPQLLAAKLGLPSAAYASKVTINQEKKQAEVTREIDGGLETVLVKLPAIISVDLRLNEPRYASLPNIMKAKKKPLEIIAAETLNINLKPLIKIHKLVAPEKRKTGKRVENAKELINYLKSEKIL